MFLFNRKFVLFSLFLFFLIIAVPVQAETNVLFSNQNIEVKAGEIFTAVIDLNAKEDRVYTNILELKYPADFLEVVFFKFEDDWTPISKVGYDLIDNDGGVLMKTAGIPRGFLGTEAFGRVSFRAKKEGKVLIEIGDNSISLDRENKNVFSSSKPQIKVNIKGQSERTEIPSKLFDINFEIDKYYIENISELISRVVFVNFGKDPTAVNLTFIIKDENGVEIYEDKRKVTVYTGEVVTKDFEKFDLDPGKYSLVLNTLYDEDVFDEFSKSFEIISEKRIYQKRVFWIPLFFTILVLVNVFIVVFERKKRKKKHLNSQK